MNSNELILNDFKKGYSKESVLLKNYNNGLVPMQQESVESRFQMYEKVANRNRSTAYVSAIKGILEDNVYSQVFFSKENVQIIQNGLRAAIYEKTGHIIPPQNMEALQIIMRSIFLQYGNFYEKGITEEIAKLNRYVLNYIIPEIHSSLKSYLHYIKDQENLKVPISQPIQVDRDFKQLEGGVFF